MPTKVKNASTASSHLPGRFDPSLFTATSLSTSDGLANAQKHVAGIILAKTSEKALHVILDGLCEDGLLFEYYYGVDPHAASFIRAALVEHFPTSPTKFCGASSSGSRWELLFGRLRNFYGREATQQPPPIVDDVFHALRVLKNLEADPEAVDLLSEQLKRQKEDARENDAEDSNEEDDYGHFIKTKKPQRAVKQARKIQARILATEKLLDQLDTILGYPMYLNSSTALHSLGKTLLASIRDALGLLLDKLVDPPIKSLATSRFLPAAPAKEGGLIADEDVEMIDANFDEPERANNEAEEYQPTAMQINAGLLFQNAPQLGPWKILVSGQAVQHLRQHKKSGALKMIFKKIKELSIGFFSDSNMKMLNASKETELPIYEAKMSKNLRLVYQIEVLPDADPEIETQGTFRFHLVWTYLNLKKGVVIWGIYNHNELRRQTWELVARQLEGRGKEYVDRCRYRWKPEKGDYYQPKSFPDPSPPPKSDSPTDKLTRQESLELHELLALQKLFPLSEHLINSIAQGRPSSHIFGPSADEIRIIQHKSACYVIGRSGTGKTTAMLFKILAVEVNYQDAPAMFSRRPRQMFVTQSRVLAARVGEYYENLSASFQRARTQLEVGNQQELTIKAHGDAVLFPDVDGDGLPGRLPDTFSKLEDSHFPIFLSFDQLCKLFENEFGLAFGKADQNAASSGSAFDPVLNVTDDQTIAAFSNTSVDYDVFLKAYWPRFAETLTKRLDPFLVFGEIIGVIKGSEQSLASANGILEEQDYINLSARTQSTFAEQRHIIYAIFVTYQKLKRSWGDFDAADRSHAILHRIQTSLFLQKKVDFLYVDEVQDHTILEAQLLRLLCRNPHGLCWAGDTAQTIAAGSSFRFDDLRASLHRLEHKEKVQSGVKTIQEPPVFQLTKNYRSHGGIVDCASSIVDLITHFWPDSIDRLEKEQGIISGSTLQPIFFSRNDQSSSEYMYFISGESRIEFGAQQCILVRDSAARDRLRSAVGDIGIILTIYECKGLEFGDVLLFDFFNDSTATLAEWRVILNAISLEERGGLSVPEFASTKYRGIGTELKNLYVALTRARSQVWIVDSSDRGEPMRAYWTARNRIVTWDSKHELPQMAVSSTPEEWREKGQILLENRRFEQAQFCFTHSGDQESVDICQAYIYRRDAEDQIRSTSGRQRDLAQQNFLLAAKAFALLSPPSRWARLAGDCFEKGGDYVEAGNSYVTTQAYREAARCFWRGEDLDALWLILTDHRGSISAKELDTYQNRLRLHFVRSEKFEKSTHLFDSEDEQLEFMEDRALDRQKARFLLHIDRKADAAEAFLSEGDIPQAIDALWETQQPNHVLKARRLLTDELWKKFPLQSPLPMNEGKERLLTSATAMQLPQKLDEINAFTSLSTSSFGDIIKLAQSFLHERLTNAAVRILDAAFDLPIPSEEDCSLSDLNDILRLLQLYISALLGCMQRPNPKIRQLLGFQCSDDSGAKTESGPFLVPLASPLHGSIERVRVQALQRTDEGEVLDGRDLILVARDFIHRQLRKVVCLVYIHNKHCNSKGCTAHGHYAADKLDSKFYLQRLQNHFQLFTIIANPSTAGTPDLSKGQRFWFEHLFDALLPPYGTVGQRCHLPPKALESIGPLKNWLQYILLTISPKAGGQFRRFYLDDLVRVALASFVLDPLNARNTAFKSTSCLIPPLDRPPDLIRHGKFYAVHDLFIFLAGKTGDYLLAGLRFIGHVLKEKITIDLNVITCLIEELCANLMLQEKMSRYRNLHRLTIPKSWVLTYFVNLPQVHEVQIKTALVNWIGQLLFELHSNTNIDHFRLVTSHTQRAPAIRAHFILRLCRCISLLAYNTGGLYGQRIQGDVVKYIGVLRKAGLEGGLYRGFAMAESWRFMEKAVENSLVGCQTDEMVQFCVIGLGELRPLTSVRQVSYKDYRELDYLVRNGLPAISRVKLSAMAPEFVSKFLPKDSNQPKAEYGAQPSAADGSGEERTQAESAIDDVAVTEDAVNDGPVLDPSQKATEAEIHACSVIQMAARGYLEHRELREARRKEIKENATFYRCYVAQLRRPDWSRDYRATFLWRLPYLLSALDRLFDAVTTARKNWKKKFNKAKQDEIDECNLRLTEISSKMKGLKKLQTAIAVDSALHDKGSIGFMEEQATSLQSLVDSSETLVGHEVAHQLRSLMKAGVLPLRSYFRPPEVQETRKELKPELNTDDLE